MEKKYRRLKYACYSTNVSMSIVANLSPILFLTFRSLYDISYSLLGLLILINFITQLSVDLIFSFFSHKFNIPKVVMATPVLSMIGLIIFALWPLLFPQTAYLGLVVGTLLFSASGGFAEVLMSPVIASIPAKDPDREMSKLHSLYAWGVVFVIIFSTTFLLLFGSRSWHYLALLLAIIPGISFLLYLGSDIPALETPSRVSGVLELMKSKTLWLCILMIFFGGASEVSMGQWSSSFLENSLGIPKVWGDFFGVALFSVMLGLGRTLYAKIGKNISKVLICGIIGSSICYLLVAVTNIPIVGMLACALTGFCVSMLWPGSLIVAANKFPQSGVFIYAIMAAGGDFGASVVPQLIGIVTDLAIQNPSVIALAQNMQLTAEQLGMKLGMLVGLLFTLIAIPLYLYNYKSNKKTQN